MSDPEASSFVGRIVFGSADTRIRATWRIIVTLVVIFGGALFGAVLLQGFPLPTWIAPVAGHLFATIAAIGGITLMARYIEHRKISDYGFSISIGWWLDLFAGVLFGCLLVGVAFGLNYVRGEIIIVDTIAIGNAPSFSLGFLVSILAWILVGFWEETLFRGHFLTNAAEGLKTRDFSLKASLFGALVSSSVVYGVLHGPFGSNPSGDSLFYALAMTIAMGGLFGIAYILSGELAVPIGLHIGINFAEHNLFLGSPESAIPTILRVEQAGSGTAVQFQSMDAIVMVPVFALGYILVAGWFYSRQGTIESYTDLVHHPPISK